MKICNLCFKCAKVYDPREEIENQHGYYHRHEFEPVGPALFKKPLVQEWVYCLPRARWAAVCCSEVKPSGMQFISVEKMGIKFDLFVV